MSEFMKNMKEDIDDEDSNLSEEKYDYNVGRDALTFMKFLKNSQFYQTLYNDQLGELSITIEETLNQRNDEKMQAIEESIRKSNESRKRAKNRKARRRLHERNKKLHIAKQKGFKGPDMKNMNAVG